MIQPIDLQLAHYNVERTAQLTKDALAVAQQTGQGKEIVEESVKRAQMVQAGLAVAETGKVKRREEEEERERRREKQDKYASGRAGSSEENAEPSEAGIEEIKAGKQPNSFELYA